MHFLIYFLFLLFISCDIKDKKTSLNNNKNRNIGNNENNDGNDNNDNNENDVILKSFTSTNRTFTINSMFIAHGENTTAFAAICSDLLSGAQKDIKFNFNQDLTGSLYCEENMKINFTYSATEESVGLKINLNNINFASLAKDKFTWGAKTFLIADTFSNNVFYYNKDKKAIEAIFCYDSSLLTTFTYDIAKNKVICSNNTEQTLENALHCHPEAITYLLFK